MRSTLLLAAAITATLVVYWSGLRGPFLFDDAFNLSPVVLWHHDAAGWLETLFGNISGLLGRPVSMLSFLLTATFGIEPFYFKFGNLLIHCLCGLIGWAVLRAVLQQDQKLKAWATGIATAAAVIWLLHPLHVSTVLYAVQRMAQLSALFSLAAVLIYINARRQLATGNRQNALKGLFILFPGAFALGLLSKENAAVAPALCLVIEAAYFTNRARWPCAVQGFFGLFFAAPVIAASLVVVVEPGRLLGGYAMRDFSLAERLLTQPRALSQYIAQLLWPRAELMGVYTDGYSASSSLLEPASTWLAIALLTGISAAAIALRHRIPVFFAGWLFFLVAHSIESSIFPLDLYYEHRNYLPSWGLLLALLGVSAHVLTWLCSSSGSARLARTLGWTVPASAVFGLAWITYGQAHVWRSFESILAHAEENMPLSARASLAASRHYAERGQAEEAQRRLDYLLAASNPRHRLLAHIESVSIRCVLGLPVTASDLASATSLALPTLTIDEVQVIGYLLNKTRGGACEGLSDQVIGNAVAEIAESATDQANHVYAKQQLRYAAALTFARSNQWSQALPQAKLAWQPGAAIEVGALLVQAQLQHTRLDDAERTIREMSARARHFDRAGHRLLDFSRAQVHQAHRAMQAKDSDFETSDDIAG